MDKGRDLLMQIMDARAEILSQGKKPIFLMINPKVYVELHIELMEKYEGVALARSQRMPFCNPKSYNVLIGLLIINSKKVKTFKVLDEESMVDVI